MLSYCCAVAVNSMDARPSMSVEPPIKKSRLLGDVDINSPHIQKLIQAKSAHMSLADEVFVALLLVNY